MKTKRIYRIGWVVIILVCLFNPLLLIVIGKHTTGKVVDLYDQTIHGRNGSINVYSVIEFQADSFIYQFTSEKNMNYRINDEVQIVYNPFNPEKAKVYSLLGLFKSSFPMLAICLIFWLAFTTSFTSLFDKPLELKIPKLPKAKFNKPNIASKQFVELPLAIKIFIIIILIVLMLVLILGIVSLIAEYYVGEINVLPMLIIVPVLGYMIYMIVKEIRKI